MARRRISKAARELGDAPESPCQHCGRVTKTTSDPADGDSIADDVAGFLGLSFLDH
jgi:hypothetical protein